MERRFEGPDGLVTVETRGNQAVFRACRPLNGPGLWKAWLVGGTGRYLLGTLIPEGEYLRLGRTVPVAQLERQGAWPPVGAELLQQGGPAVGAPPPPGWSRRERAAELLPDPLLARCLGESPVLFRPEAGGFTLALPWRADRPCPLTPLFCLARMERLEGKNFLLFSFDTAGQPVLSEKE